MLRRKSEKNPEYKNSEGKIISQCPECRDVLIKYQADQYGPRTETSIGKFGPSVPKVLCNKCVARLQI